MPLRKRKSIQLFVKPLTHQKKYKICNSTYKMSIPKTTKFSKITKEAKLSKCLQGDPRLRK